MFLDLFNQFDSRIVALYQRLVNISNRVTGGGEEHLRLAKLALWTDPAVTLIIHAIMFNYYKMPSGVVRFFIVLIFLFLILYWLRATQVVKISEKLKRSQTLAANPLAYAYRRASLLSLLIILLLNAFQVLRFIEQADIKTLLVIVAATTATYFNMITSSYYFLSCVPPPRQKSLLARLKERLSFAPQPVPVPNIP